MSTQTEAAPSGTGAVTELTYREAINAALEDAMSGDPAVLLMGEDVSADGGVFKTNIGLVEKFGLDLSLLSQLGARPSVPNPTSPQTQSRESMSSTGPKVNIS